jgi:ribosomal protein L11 methylase PrmA
MPTSQEFINIFSNYVSQTDMVKKATNLVDLGCGSGILSIIAKENGEFNGKYTLID